jgi:hypothetical protein
MATQLIEVSSGSTEVLPVGTRLRFDYNYTGLEWTYAQAAFQAIVEKRLSGLGYLNISSVQWNDRVLSIYGTVIQPESGVRYVTGPDGQQYPIYEADVSPKVIVGIFTIALAGLLWLSLDKIYKIINTPGGQVLAAGTGIGLIAFAVIAIVAFFSLKGKGKAV